MYLALDLATRTGAAFWSEGWEKPRSMRIDLPPGSKEDPAVGRACLALHRRLNELHKTFGPITRIYYEEPLAPSGMAGFSTLATFGRLLGLIAHADSFGEAIGARVRSVPMGVWRKHFLGKGAGLKSKQFKEMAVERCRNLGWNPSTHDEADALGVLDYAIHLAGITPPWSQGFMKTQFTNGASI